MLIVVATNNDTETLKKCLSGITCNTDLSKHPLLVSDTGSTSRAHLDFVRGLPCNKAFSIKPNYEYGAYLYAVKRYPSESEFMFMQDSVVPQNPGWLDRFTKPGLGAVAAWPHSINNYTTDEHWDWIQGVVGELVLPVEQPRDMFMCNTFYATRDAIETVQSKFDMPVPSKKMHSQAYERLMPILFYKSGVHFRFAKKQGHLYKIPPEQRTNRPI
jgi:hypothetical protein